MGSEYGEVKRGTSDKDRYVRIDVEEFICLEKGRCPGNFLEKETYTESIEWEVHSRYSAKEFLQKGIRGGIFKEGIVEQKRVV